jgi:hypothetical protein
MVWLLGRWRSPLHAPGAITLKQGVDFRTCGQVLVAFDGVGQTGRGGGKFHGGSRHGELRGEESKAAVKASPVPMRSTMFGIE